MEHEEEKKRSGEGRFPSILLLFSSSCATKSPV
jgi:hypothetical protein